MTPILIPMKAHSVRCADKNKILLPHTLEYIKNSKLNNPVWILTDKEFKVSKKYPFKLNIWVEKDKNPHQCEFHSIKKFIENYNEDFGKPKIDNFIWLPVTQPCRDKNLLGRAIMSQNALGDKYKLITSNTIVPDRKIFELDCNNAYLNNFNFLIPNINRTGSAVTMKFVADGAIYATTYSFIKECVDSLDANKHFWNTKIWFIRNSAPLMDIDTEEDLEMFKTYFKNNL